MKNLFHIGLNFGIFTCIIGIVYIVWTSGFFSSFFGLSMLMIVFFELKDDLNIQAALDKIDIKNIK